MPSKSLYQQYLTLFNNYSHTTTDDGPLHRMIVVVHNGRESQTCIITHDRTKPIISLIPWHGSDSDMVCVDENDTTNNSRLLSRILHTGTPFPRNGSLFGWKQGNTVTAMIVACANRRAPGPSLLTMPLADSEPSRWPTFINEQPMFGSWFWDYFQAQRIVSLDTAVSRTYDTVYWIEIPSGPRYCVVTEPISNGIRLPRGSYVPFQTLNAGTTIPKMTSLPKNALVRDLGSALG